MSRPAYYLLELDNIYVIENTLLYSY